MIHVHGWDISQQMAMTGAVVGLSYSAVAAGLILVFRANGIINFAVIAFGSVALGAFGVLTEHGWGLWPCMLVAVPLAALLAMVLEVVVIRRLADAPRLVLLMATIGIAQFLGFAVLVFAELLPDVPPGGDFPTLVPGDWSLQVTKDLVIGAREISVLIAIPVLVILLALFMTRTRFGLMVRAAASNTDKSRLVGIPVARTSTLVWGVAAAFTAVTIIVLAAVQFVTPLGAANGTAELTLGYPVLVKALLIAMIARMRILWLTIPVGMALGVVEVIFQQNVQGIDANVFRVVAVRSDARGGAHAPPIRASRNRNRHIVEARGSREAAARTAPQSLGHAPVAAARDRGRAGCLRGDPRVRANKRRSRSCGRAS